MKAGFSQAVITPEVGSEMPGMFKKRFGESVHDELLVTAMVVEGESESVALVGVDALSIKRSVVLSARERIAARTGIAAGNVMVAASHTHNGGATCEVFLSESSAEYCAFLGDRIADAVIAAWENRVAARFKFGSGYQDGVAFNRRFRMVGGAERTHPGRGNADVVEPAGPVDPEVGVIGAFAVEDERFLGCFVNYTCHCTVGVGGTGFSADYVYYLREMVRLVMENEAAQIVFMNGACGDVTQIDNQLPLDAPAQRGPDCGKLIGRSVGAEVVKILSRQGSEDEVPVRMKSEILQLAPRVLDADKVAAARELLASRREEDGWDRDTILARELVLLAEMNEAEPEIVAEVQAIRVGETVIVSNPAEYFCAFGLDIKARSLAGHTCVVELANGCVGYVPGFEQVVKAEGYEPTLCRSSKLAPEAGENIVESSVSLVNSVC